MAYDVAINTNFYHKLETSALFRLFVIQVASQGVGEKFSIEFKRGERQPGILSFFKPFLFNSAMEIYFQDFRF